MALNTCCEVYIQELHEARNTVVRYRAIIDELADTEADRSHHKEFTPPEPVEKPCLQCEILQEKYESQISSLEEKLNKKIVELKEMKADLREKCLEAQSNIVSQTQIAKLQDELSLSVEKIEELTRCIEKKDNEIEDIVEALEAVNKQLESEKNKNTNLQENLASFTEQLKELECEKASLTSELAAIKAGSDIGERGNSLFSEVEEHRQKAVSQFMILRSKYEDLKTQLVQQKKINETQELQVLELTRTMKQVEEKKLESAMDRIARQSEIIQELEKSNKQLIDVVAQATKTFTHEDCSFSIAHNMIASAREESGRILEEKTKLSMKRYNLTEKVWSAEANYCAIKKDLAKMECEINILQKNNKSLQEKLNDAQRDCCKCKENFKEPFCPSASVRELNSTSTSSKTVSFSADTKENEGRPLRRMRPKPIDCPIYSMVMDPVTGKCKMVQLNKEKTEETDSFRVSKDPVNGKFNTVPTIKIEEEENDSSQKT